MRTTERSGYLDLLAGRPVEVAGCVVGDDLVIEIRGDLDLATVEDATAAITRLGRRAEFGRVLLHTREVGFCDSTGLQLLVRLRGLLGIDPPVVLLSTSTQVERVLDLTGAMACFERDVDPT